MKKNERDKIIMKGEGKRIWLVGLRQVGGGRGREGES